MKALSLVLSLLFSYSSFGQITKTTYKTFSKIEDINTLNIVFGQEIEVEEWTERRILVETTIKMTSANKNILKYLVESGRYDLEEEISGGTITLKFKDILDKKMVLRGTEIWEALSIIVFAPKAVTVNVTSPPPKVDPEIYAEGEDYSENPDYGEDPDYGDSSGDEYYGEDVYDSSDPPADENINYFDLNTPDDVGDNEYEYDPD